MAETTLEEAKRCPFCKEPGEITGEQQPSRAVRAPYGAKILVVKCRNARCSEKDQVCRLIQVNADGTIPPPSMENPSMFPKLPDDYGRTEERLQEELRQQLQGSAEIRSPWSK